MDNHRYIILNTGALMPRLGLGTWKSRPGSVGSAVEYALLECGYKHIDCAAIYKNEKEIGQKFEKIFKSGIVKREDVFVTSKLWNTSHAPTEVTAACQQTLTDLQLEYLDLYLMHWGIAERPNSNDEALDTAGKLITPKISVRETWEALEGLVTAGLVKAIGVANFSGPMLIDLLTYAIIPPAMNQIELHPYNQQTRLVEFCQHQGIAVTAYSPLGSPGTSNPNEPHLLQDPVVMALAAAHNKTPAQILIRWALERGTVVIPKSVTLERIKSNGEVFDFELTPEDKKQLAALEQRYRFVDLWDWLRLPYFE